MTVLHYISTIDTNSGTAPDYVNSLIRATRNVVDSHVVTDNELGNSIFSIHKKINTIITERKPDLIHIHAAWNHRAAIVQREASKRGVFIILSLHGGLSPDVLELDFWKNKLPRLAAYQFSMVRHCHAIVAVSEEEEQHLRELDWKRRIVTIPHPALFPVGNDTICEKLTTIYRKVIDTNYHRLIKKEEMLFTLKCAALQIWEEHKDFDITTATSQHEAVKSMLLQDISEILEQYPFISYRRIHLFAFDNGIREKMLEGAKIANVPIPPLSDMNAIPRFKPHTKREKYKTKYQKLCSIISEISSDCNSDTSRCETFSSDFTISGSISLQTVCKIFIRLRFANYDEDIFRQRVKKAGLTDFTSRFLYLLSQVFHMEIGYMPLEPKEQPLYNIRKPK